MQAVLLAAGISSRFIPFTSQVAHKSLITLMGKTLLEHTLYALKQSGITEVILVVNKEAAFREAIGDGSSLGLSIIYVTLPEAKGMGAALLQAKEYLQDTFFLLNAYHVEAEAFIADMRALQETKDTIVLVGKKDDGRDAYGYMHIDPNRVTGVIEKPSETLADTLRIVGIYLLNKAYVAVLEETPLAHYHFETALDTYAKTNNIRYIETEKETITLKYPWHLLAIKNYLLKKITHFISPEATISPKATITGEVYIAEGVTVLAGAQIKGPVYLGKDSFVGTNALLRNGVVLEKKGVIGSFIEIKNAHIMEYATTHTGLLEDSVVGRSCKIAAGILTANVRLDRKHIWSVVKGEKVNSYLNAFGVIIGDHVNIGVRVTTMPGTIIGNNVLVGPSTVVMKNIQDNTKYYTKFTSIVEERIDEK